MTICLNFQNLTHLFWTIIITLSIYVIYLIICVAKEYRLERVKKVKATLKLKQFLGFKRQQRLQSIGNYAIQHQLQITEDLEATEPLTRGKVHRTNKPSTNLVQRYTSTNFNTESDNGCDDKSYRRSSKKKPTFSSGPTTSKIKDASTGIKESELSCVFSSGLNEYDYFDDLNADIFKRDDDLD